MPSIHDNHILSYEVDFQNETLVMRTIDPYNENAKIIDVIFSGYLAHFFTDVQKVNILSEIDEYPLNKFLERKSGYLEDVKGYAWPVMCDTEKELLDYLQESNYKPFLVGSSWGLSGWVLCKKMEIVHG